MIIKRFHQFVILERGPVKTAIIDFLKGDVYQVENTVIELFKIREYEEIADFIQSCKKEELIVEVDEKLWIPRISFEKENEVLRKNWGSMRS